MEPPDSAIETEASVVWVDCGIIHVRSKGITSTRATAEELADAVHDLVDGPPMPAFFDARRWRKGDPDAWTTFTSNLPSLFSAAAFLVAPELSPQLSEFPEAINRLIIPFKVFTDEADALAFLQGFLPGEQLVMDPPDDAIDAISSLVWMEDGIIIARATGAPSTPESVAQVFAAIRDLIGEGSRRPYLFDARKWPGGDVSVWTIAVAEFESTLTAQAMLVAPESSVGKGPFFLDRMPIPFRVFTDETEALAFLRGFMPDE